MTAATRVGWRGCCGWGYWRKAISTRRRSAARAAHCPGIDNQIPRARGRKLGGAAVKKPTTAGIEELIDDADARLSIESTLAAPRCLDEPIATIETTAPRRLRPRPAHRAPRAVSGVARILASVILLATGAPARFADAGHYASYCRCVDSKRLSNGKRKGAGKRKNGNRYLSWASVEAAHFAIRYEPRARRYYEPKKAKTNAMVALKAVAHKLARACYRACYYVMRDGVPFDAARCFG